MVNAAKGKEDETMNVASGKYNKMIDTKIAEIKSDIDEKTKKGFAHLWTSHPLIEDRIEALEKRAVAMSSR